VTNNVFIVLYKFGYRYNISMCTDVIKQVYHFSGISGNLAMSGNLAKVREKALSQGKVREFV